MSENPQQPEFEQDRPATPDLAAVQAAEGLPAKVAALTELVGALLDIVRRDRDKLRLPDNPPEDSDDDIPRRMDEVQQFLRNIHVAGDLELRGGPHGLVIGTRKKPDVLPVESWAVVADDTIHSDGFGPYVECNPAGFMGTSPDAATTINVYLVGMTDPATESDQKWTQYVYEGQPLTYITDPTDRQTLVATCVYGIPYFPKLGHGLEWHASGGAGDRTGVQPKLGDGLAFEDGEDPKKFNVVGDTGVAVIDNGTARLTLTFAGGRLTEGAVDSSTGAEVDWSTP